MKFELDYTKFQSSSYRLYFPPHLDPPYLEIMIVYQGLRFNSLKPDHFTGHIWMYISFDTKLDTDKLRRLELHIIQLELHLTGKARLSLDYTTVPVFLIIGRI